MINSVRCTLAAITLSAFLAGCGGTQNAFNLAPSSATQHVAQSGHTASEIVTSARMKPGSSSQSVVYITGYADGNVYEYTYPQGQLVGTLTGFISPEGECSDALGDVFIVARADTTPYSNSVIYEYAPGGTTPIEVLSDPTRGVGCAVDPSSGDLAVSGGYVSSGAAYGDVAVFAQAQGTPTVYSSTLEPFELCSYDIKGNLYISAYGTVSANGFVLLRLSRGSNTFVQMTIDETLYGNAPYPPSVLWDGKRIAVSSASARESNPSYIYRLDVSGTSAKTVGTTMLRSDRGKYRTGQVAIYGNHVLSSHYKGGAGGVDVWSYPKAGKAHAFIRKASRVNPFGIVVSTAAAPELSEHFGLAPVSWTP